MNGGGVDRENRRGKFDMVLRGPGGKGKGKGLKVC